MPSLDSSYLIDLLAGQADAIEFAQLLESNGKIGFLTPPTASEVYIGAFRAGPEYLASAERLLEGLPVLPFDRESARLAGKLGATLLDRGTPIGQSDLYIAAITMRHQESLVTRDSAFSRVPGLRVETY